MPILASINTAIVVPKATPLDFQQQCWIIKWIEAIAGTLFETRYVAALDTGRASRPEMVL